MTSVSADHSLSLAEFRQVAIRAQLLDRKIDQSVDPGDQGIARVVQQAGFVRTLGGADAYLALRARIPNLTRLGLDQAVEERVLQVVPAARSCIYLVAQRDVPSALTFAYHQRAGRDSREYEKACIQPGELESLGHIIEKTLEQNGRLSTTMLRKHLPAGSYRSLGDPGKKVGISSTLPPALRLLEFAGRIGRFLEGKRLDSERYLWGVSSRETRLRIQEMEAGPVLNSKLAEIFFRAAGLASQRMFADWAGLSKGDAEAAIQRLNLPAYQIEGESEQFFGAAEIAPKSSRGIAFLPFEDNLLSLRGGPRLLVDRRYHDIPVPRWGRSKGECLGEARHSTLRTIVSGDRVAGFWEFNPESREVETFCFEGLTSDQRARVASEAIQLAGFLEVELGHARSFSLDTDTALEERVGFIRKLRDRH